MEGEAIICVNHDKCPWRGRVFDFAQTKEFMDSIQELRDALEYGMPHRRGTNMRKVLPKVGQRIRFACSTHNVYYSRPGDHPARKVIEPLYIDAAVPGQQYVVLDTTAGDIGHAHYDAVRINISQTAAED